MYVSSKTRQRISIEILYASTGIYIIRIILDRTIPRQTRDDLKRGSGWILSLRRSIEEGIVFILRITVPIRNHIVRVVSRFGYERQHLARIGFRDDDSAVIIPQAFIGILRNIRIDCRHHIASWNGLIQNPIIKQILH